MHQRRIGTLLPLIGAALILMGIMAVTARAEEALKDGGKAASFLVNKLTSLAKAGVTFEVNQVGTGAILVLGKYDILCTGGVAAGEFKSSTEALFGAKFTGCTVWSPVEVGKTHTAKLPCTMKGESIVVEKAIALSKKHEGLPYVLVEEDGSAFTTINFEGMECPLPKTTSLRGSIVGKVINSDTVEPTLEFSQAIQKLFQVGLEGDHLRIGTFEGYIDGAVNAKLTDATHKGLTLGVC